MSTKSKLDKAKGRAKEAAGALVDDDKLRREGKRDQAAGKVEGVVDEVVEKAKHAARSTTSSACFCTVSCEGLSSTRSQFAFSVFERAFKNFGLPGAIRTDNGAPFASANALFGLSKLAVWWLRLGIQIQRIKPGCPQQNGRHERMHLTLKKEATKPASFNFLQQQERFDRFAAVYNHERPHQALGGAYLGEVYTPSARAYAPPPEPEYPFHDRSVRVTRCGRICLGKRKINLSRAFAGEIVGIREVDDQVWLVSFLDFDLGFFDREEGRVEPTLNPFGPEKVSTMSPE